MQQTEDICTSNHTETGPIHFYSFLHLLPLTTPMLRMILKARWWKYQHSHQPDLSIISLEQTRTLFCPSYQTTIELSEWETPIKNADSASVLLLRMPYLNFSPFTLTSNYSPLGNPDNSNPFLFFPVSHPELFFFFCACNKTKSCLLY